MDEIVKSLLLQVPLAGAVVVALIKVYNDGKADRAYMMTLLEKAYLRIAEMAGDDPHEHDDTLMQRPGS